MYNDITINCVTTGSGQTCTIPFSSLSTAFVTPQITSGELIVSFFLLLILVVLLIQLLIPAIRTVPILRKFLGNNSIDGKEINTIWRQQIF